MPSVFSPGAEKARGPKKTRGAIKRPMNRGAFMAHFNRLLRKDAGNARVLYWSRQPQLESSRMAAPGGLCLHQGLGRVWGGFGGWH